MNDVREALEQQQTEERRFAALEAAATVYNGAVGRLHEEPESVIATAKRFEEYLLTGK